MLLRIIYLLFVISAAYSAPVDDVISKACAVEDFECLRDMSEHFFEVTASGNEELGIKPYDPLIIDSIHVDAFDGVSVIYTNVNITGLRKQKVIEYKIDNKAKSAKFTVNTDVNIKANIELDYEKTKKKYSGTYTGSGKAVLSASNNYEIKPNDKGVEHFVSGPVTITCNFETLKADSNKELIEALEKDPHAKEIYDKTPSEAESLEKKNACEIMKVAYAKLMDDLESVEKIYPANAFFTNA